MCCSRTAQPQVHAGAMNNAAHNLRDFLDSSDLGRQAPQGLASGLTGLDKGHLHFPQDCNSSSCKLDFLLLALHMHGRRYCGYYSNAACQAVSSAVYAQVMLR